MKPPKTILLVEDSGDDETLVRRVLRKTGHDARLLVARDGQEALEYLRTVRPDSPDRLDAPRLVLLDLKMPRMGGIDLLRQIKADAWLRTVPVVVFTSSAEEIDVLECSRLGASSYVRKPIEYEAYADTLGRVLDYWLNVNQERPSSANHHEPFAY